MVLAVEDDRRVARAGSVTPHQRRQRWDQCGACRHPEEADLQGKDHGRTRDDHKFEVAQSGGTNNVRHVLTVRPLTAEPAVRGYTGYFADPDGVHWEICWNPGPIGQLVLPD